MDKVCSQEAHILPKEMDQAFLSSLPGYENHEKVYMSSYRGEEDIFLIIAIHSTVCGPALGGLRLAYYKNKEEAFSDALRLSAAMTYKNVLAGIPYGGGKAVLFVRDKDSMRDSLYRKSVFEWVGEQVNYLNGTYLTAEDLNVSVEDVSIISTRTAHVKGLVNYLLPGEDLTSEMTAWGVWKAIQICIQNPHNEKFVVQGAGGKVGRVLAEYIYHAGGDLYVSDLLEKKNKLFEILRSRKIERYTYLNPEDVFAIQNAILVPCALGGILNSKTIPELVSHQCRAVIGCANNQLEKPEDGDLLHENGILYAPDYVINMGGVIGVATLNYNRGNIDYVRSVVARRIYSVLTEVFQKSQNMERAPSRIAEEMAREFLAKKT